MKRDGGTPEDKDCGLLKFSVIPDKIQRVISSTKGVWGHLGMFIEIS